MSAETLAATRASISTPVSAVVADFRGNSDAILAQPQIDINECKRQRMAHRNQFCGAFGGHDSRDARDFQRIALGILRKRRQHFWLDRDKGAGLGLALRRAFARDIDHPGAARAVVMGKFVAMQ